MRRHLLVVTLLLGTLAAPFAVLDRSPGSAADGCPPGSEPVRELPDGTWTCAHPHTGAGAEDSAYAPVGTAMPLACYGSGKDGDRFEAVSVREAAQDDRFAMIADDIRRLAGEADVLVQQSAAKTGGYRQLRWATTSGAPGCEVSVGKVVVPAGTAAKGFWSVVKYVRDAGFDDDGRRYILFVDDDTPYCGTGELVDTDAKIDNVNDRRPPLYSAVGGSCVHKTRTVLHEMLHTVGAVQQSAPNSNGAGHCTDGPDIMCYADSTGVPVKTVCPGTHSADWLDCNNDDYFHTDPPAGSYLDTKWNTADSRFLLHAPPGEEPPAIPPVSAVDTDPSLPPAERYVNAVHRLFLGRPAAAAELRLWSPAAASSRSALTGALAVSDEWAGVRVDGLYRRFLNRPSEPAGRAYWVGRVAAGSRVEDIAALVVGSDEYLRRNGGKPETFVDAVYSDVLGRNADLAGRSYWAGQVGAGVTRQTVASGFYASVESRRSRVDGLYREVLDRSPDADGLRYWVDRLLVSGDVELSALLAASDEFWRRSQL